MKEQLKKLAKIFAILMTALVLGGGLLISCAPTATPDGAVDYPRNPTNTRPIVCLGDSLTNGNNSAVGNASNYTALRPQSYPTRLQDYLKVPVINISKSGITSANAASTTIGATTIISPSIADVPPTNGTITTATTYINAVIAYNPQAVILCLGSNDFNNNVGTTLTTVRSNANTVLTPNYKTIINAILAAVPDCVFFLGDGMFEQGVDDIPGNNIITTSWATTGTVNYTIQFNTFKPLMTTNSTYYMNEYGQAVGNTTTLGKNMTDAQIRVELFDIYKSWNDVLRVTIPAFFASGGGAAYEGDVRYIGCTYRDSWDSAVAGPLLILSDTQHPNSDGYRLMAASIFNRTYDFLMERGLVKEDHTRKVDITKLYKSIKGL